MSNALDGTQPAPEGETAGNPGNETAPEQMNDKQHNGAESGHETEEAEGAAEGAEDEAGAEGSSDEDGTPDPEPKKKVSFKDLPKWATKRINEETQRRQNIERELEVARAELERSKKGDSADAADQPDIDTLVNQRAQQMTEQKEFTQRIASWSDAGVKDFGAEEFNASCNFIAEFMDAKQKHQFMSVLTDPEVVEDGHKVIMALADDPDEAERIIRLPPAKQAVALSRLSAKVNKPAAPAPKPISKVPAPVTPIGGKTQAASRLDDPDVPMDKFADEFLKNLANRHK